MKYESNILKRLIDTYGVIGNPCYLSEIIKEFIVRGKELYPQLFTYQADWLAHIDEFGLTPNYVVSYTGQQIYAPHTKESPVKRAILKGQTLVNLLTNAYISDGVIRNNNVSYSKGNTTYTLIYNVTAIPTTTLRSTFMIALSNGDTIYQKASPTVIHNMGINKWVFNTPSDVTFSSIGYWSSGEDVKLCANNIVLLEGDYSTIDIPYFEGMQSVKLPVLTTSNEDGTKTNILSTSKDVELRGIGDVRDELDCLTGEVTERISEIVADGVNFKFVKGQVNGEYKDGSVRFDLQSLNDILVKSPNYWADTSEVIINDRLKTGFFPTFASTKEKDVLAIWGNVLFVVFSDTNIKTIEQANEWLKQNPITIQYKLATESIKTVDLTIHDKDHQKVERLTSFEGGTHFTTSSQDGSLLPTLTVDVVTDLEEALMVCSLEGNTM